jgi:hypothetical protein
MLRCARGVSPYVATMTEIVARFGTSTERLAILAGLLDYRAALAAVGIAQGFHWIDGSFVENCEALRQRPPGDVDIVTFAYRAVTPDWSLFVSQHAEIFDPRLSKAQFKCDAYYIDPQKPPNLIAEDSAYFNGLFSHQRDTLQWKGMLSIDLNSDDAAARRLI